MQSVYKALDRSDRIVIASPIYFYGVTSQTKAVIDRAQAFWSRQRLKKKPAEKVPTKSERKGFFISVGATLGKRLFDGALFTIRYFFGAMDVEYTGELVYRGIDEKGAIRNHPTALTDTYEAGLRFVIS
jgi:multimeric flavodoxin WrbA